MIGLRYLKNGKGYFMSFTREQWCRDVLAALGNKSPNMSTIYFMVGWTLAETLTNSGAKFNLLNTTWNMLVQGQTDFNSVGVKNYPDYNTGIQATVRSLNDGYYPTILSALKNNFPFIDNLTSPILNELNKWCGGCGYGYGFVSQGHIHLRDEFNYGSSSQETPSMNEATEQQRNEAILAWNSYCNANGKTPPPIDTGIFKSWLSDWVNHFRFYGSPIGYEEYGQTNWSGDPITIQHFTGARAEWSIKTGTCLWIGPTGILNN